MPNLATVLKDETRRLARKEVRSETATIKRMSAQHRRDIAELKRQVRELTREVSHLRKQETKLLKKRPAEGETTGARFSPGWVKKHRDRLELSAADYGTLVGVSGLTIYNWEKGKTRPRQQQLAAWSAVRGLGKREALRRLEMMER